ncbi:hypothetical protein BJX64DRAFT_290651 [Aspergillus heterothallicus]
MSNLKMTEGSDGLQVAREWDNYPEHYDPPTQVTSPVKQDSQYAAVPLSPPATQLPTATVCGLSRRTFIITATIGLAIVLAGALGGGLGAGLSSQRNCSGQCSSSVADNSPNATETVTVTVSVESTASATQSASTSTSTTGHYSDCPSSNGTDYTSTMFTSGESGDVPDGAKNGLKFSKICGFDVQGTNLAEADFSTFDECIDLCASYNFWSGSTDCNVASYNNEGTCWIKSGGTTQVSDDAVDSAVLADSS